MHGRPVLGPPGFESVPYLAAPVVGDSVQQRPRPAVWRSTIAHARAYAEALFCEEDGKPNAERIEWLLNEFAAFLEASALGGRRARMTLSLCLFACQWLAPLFIRRMGPLTELSISDRITALDRMERSSLGPATLAPKAMLCLLWFENPAVQKETDTVPTCLTQIHRRYHAEAIAAEVTT